MKYKQAGGRIDQQPFSVDEFDSRDCCWVSFYLIGVVVKCIFLRIIIGDSTFCACPDASLLVGFDRINHVIAHAAGLPFFLPVDGKVITIKGRSVLGGGLPDDKFVFGRHVMTCCVEDIQFAGLVCVWKDAAQKLTHGGWVTITAQVKWQYDEMYGEAGPVLYCSSVEEAEEADPEVAQF